MICVYCSQTVPKARHEADYNYCMAKNCGDKALRSRQDEYRLILLPKQGYTYVHKDSISRLHTMSYDR
jgi:hypothetical protein